MGVGSPFELICDGAKKASNFLETVQFELEPYSAEKEWTVLRVALKSAMALASLVW